MFVVLFHNLKLVSIIYFLSRINIIRHEERELSLEDVQSVEHRV